MGLIRSKYFKILFVIMAVAVLSQISASAGNSQVVRKEIENLHDYEAGDEVDIVIRIPGSTKIIKTPADVMLVMDRTGSMGESFVGICPGGSPCVTRIKAAKEALKIFVDNVNDNVSTGLATYANTGTSADIDCRTAVPPYHLCATLNYGMKVMTAGNSAAIKASIDSFGAAGNTSVGSGMHFGNMELLDQVDPPGFVPFSESTTSRVAGGVRKFMILATDGLQNRRPSPNQASVIGGPQSIIQDAIDGQITVYTLGIASDASEALMKQIACQTDQFDADPCVVGSLTGNVPTNPHNYKKVSNFAELKDYFLTIASEISAAQAYGIIDSINTDIFTRIKTGTLRSDTITNCADSTQIWPSHDLFYNGQVFFVNINPIPEGTEVCIRFTAILEDPFPEALLDMPQAVNSIGIAASIDPDFNCVGLSILKCVTSLISFPRVDIQNAFIVIVNPYKPWLQTTRGDVGSRGGGPPPISIGPIDADHLSPPLFNADYLVISSWSRDPDFSSGLGWYIDNYTGININPQPIGNDIYGALRADKQTCPLTSATWAGIKSAIISAGGCRNLQFTGDFDINNSPGSYDGPPTTIFVDGSINVASDINIDNDTGLIFVSNQNINVVTGVRRIDGFFIANGTFTSSNSSCSSGLVGVNNPLIVNGAVYAFTQFCLTRDLSVPGNSNGNDNVAAEQINYEPKYLFLFPDISSNTQVIYREVAP